MTQHALDAMIYAWMVMKEKEESSMEGIYVGKVKRSVINKDDVNLLFIDHRQDIHHLGEVIDYGDTAYCLVPTNDIIINNDELLKLKDRVKELEGQLKDAKKESDKKLCEVYMETNAALHNGAYRLIAIGKELEDLKKQAEQMEELEKDRDAWKRRFNTADKMVADLKKKNQTLTDRNSELNKELDRIRNISIDSISKALLPFGVHVGLVNPKGPGTFELDVDIPELTEAKKKIAELEQKLEAAKSNESYWCDRKEIEEDLHRYWVRTFDRAVEQAEQKGVFIGVRGYDEECNAGVVIVENRKAEELEVKIGELKKELEGLKSKKITKCTLDPSDNKLTFIYTYMDGHNESTCIIDDVDPNGIPRDITPKCSSCAHHIMHRPSLLAHDWCYIPVSKEGPGTMRKLNKEEAEGPACSNFKARKE